MELNTPMPSKRVTDEPPSRALRDDRGRRSDSLRSKIEDAIRKTTAHRYGVINPQIDRFKADHPDWAQHYDMMEHQSKHTAQAPFHSPEDVYTSAMRSTGRKGRL